MREVEGARDQEGEEAWTQHLNADTLANVMMDIGNILNRTVKDFKDHSLVLVISNVLWLIGALPGVMLLGYGWVARSFPLLVMGCLLWLPYPLLTVGLFRVAQSIAEGTMAGIGSLLPAAWENRSRALQWGLINLMVLSVLMANVRFYNDPNRPFAESAIGPILSSVFLSLTALWILLQGYALAYFPVLERANPLKLSLRSFHLISTHPIVTFCIALILILLLFTAILVPLFGLLTNFSLAALLLIHTRTTLQTSDPSEGEVNG